MKEREPKYLKNEEIAELFSVINADRSRYACRNKAIFHLALYCALRVSEITNMELSHYDPDRGQIYCRRQKGSNNNTIRIIDRKVSSAMNEYLSHRASVYPESPYMFPSQKGSPISRKRLDAIMKEYCKKTSIPLSKQHFHVLKHTRAVELGNSGLDIKDIQWWLGHKSITNTMIYMQYTTNQQEALYRKLAGGSIYEENQCYF